ncbi:MAG TPA: hypothetical protein VF668_01220 [Pyrinomonadaceae bacterium]|jgi:glucosamine 6-phosphate synthetase-like amidotransferase/phosphosugar isomerase protein
MCGIFGFSGESPDKETVKLLAHGAARRGQDGYGLGWLDRGGRPRSFRSQDKLSRALHELNRLEGASVALGHARLATVGRADDPRNFHPFAAGDSTLLVQNGNVYNFKQLVAEHAIRPATDCDSEVLAHLVAAGEGAAGQRLTRALSLVESPAFAVAVIHGGRLAVARRRLPLFGVYAGGVFYFSSAAFAVGEHEASPLAENGVVEVSPGAGAPPHVNLAKYVIPVFGLKTPAQTQSAWQQIRPPKGQ